MKKLSKKEVEKISFVRAKNERSAIGKEVVNLEVGEGVDIDRKEWGKEMISPSPHFLTGQIGKRTNRKFTCKSRHDKSGWVIIRLA